MQWADLEREHRVYASFFKAHMAIKVIKILDYPEESIRNTEVPETLNYAPFCVITEINIAANSSKSVRFRMGGHEDLDDEKFIWTYTSLYFPMSQENHLQNFKLSKPVLCIGGILQIELWGRASVSRVEVLGQPLNPAFLVDNLRPSGKFSLKYSPAALLRTLQKSSSVGSLPEHREHRMWHLRGSRQFRMQRNEQGELIELRQFRMQRNEQEGGLIEWNGDEDNELDRITLVNCYL